LRQSNYELENALDLAPSPVAPIEPSKTAPRDDTDQPDINGWHPAPKSGKCESWIRVARAKKLRRFLDISIELIIHETDVVELNEKAELVNCVWKYCDTVDERAQQAQRKGAYRKVSTRRLAQSAADHASHITYDFDLSYLVCRTHAENSVLIQPAELIPIGWIPFHHRQIDYYGDSFRFCGVKARPVLSVPDPVTFCAGSFNRDEAGRWYIDTSIEVDVLDMRITK
jgi:hypothetical protein